MRIATCVFVALVFVPVNDSVQAQQVTDTELRAAYCLAVTTRQYENTVAREKRGPHNEYTAQAADALNRIILARRDRMRDYLTAKGLLHTKNTGSIEVALRRGDADAAPCAIDIEDPVYKQCNKSCGPMNEVEDYRRCDGKCPSSEACTRIKRCLENFLPF